jgi:hypothetical protein
MAHKLGWGQSQGSVAQVAYIVQDLEASIAQFIRDRGAGPFFVLDHFWQPGQVFRGEPSLADATIAMGFSGQTWFELIQPLDDHPSIYREAITARGYGFHHHGIAFEDCEAQLPRYAANGWHEAYRAGVPTGGEVIYLDHVRSDELGYIELLPATPGMDQTFTRFWKAAQDWDGSDPVRPFA